MNTVVLYGPRNLVTEDRPLPGISNNQVLIRTSYTGICGSDLHRYNNSPGWITPYPVILGHETSGVVAEVGRNVTKFRVGDRVVIEPIVSCRHCKYCMEGNYHLCVDLKTIPLHLDGSFADYIAFDACFVHKIPDNMELLLGVLVEPISVSLHAVRMCNPGPGKSAVVLGAGPIGLIAAMLLRYYGVSSIIVTDFIESRLQVAQQIGIPITVNVKEKNTQNLIKKYMPSGADIVIEASGSHRAIETSAEIIRRGGCVCLVGVPGVCSFDFFKLFSKEATIKTSYKYNNEFPIAIEILAEATLDWKKLITNTFNFSEISKAMNYISDHPDKCIKAVIQY